MNKVIAYTDGSAVVKGKAKGHGGFGTYFPDLYGSKQAFSLGFKDTKTGRMELSALYYAITAIRIDSAVELVIYSDSEYVVKSFTLGRLKKWIAAGWRNTSGEVKNKDLWKAIKHELDMRPLMTLEMIHIRSHQVEKEKDAAKKQALMQDPNIIGNMMADRLADYKRHTELLTSDKV
tara:strand:- start:2579 stop:3109 length:531 start_codon:yes stop_codon:yes gene_type:complete